MGTHLAKTGYDQRYHWAPESLVPQMEVRVRPGEPAVAFLTPSTGEDDLASLSALRARLSASHLDIFDDFREGRPVWRVTGFDAPDTLAEALHAQGATQGPPNTELSSYKRASKKGENTIKTSAAFYLLGDVLGLIGGIVRGRDLPQLGMALSFGAGDVLFATYTAKPEKEAQQVRRITGELKTYLAQQHIPIPDESALNAEHLAQPNGFLHGVDRFVRDNLISLKCLTEVIGGAFHSRAGFTQGNDQKKFAGIIIVVGWLAAMLLKEKRHDPARYKDADIVEKTLGHIQEHPLVLAGSAGYIHNAITAFGAWKEHDRQQQLDAGDGSRSDAYKWDLAMVSSMIVGNTAYNMSHKSDAPEEINSPLIQEMAFYAADALRQLPPDLQADALQHTAAFLAKKTGGAEQALSAHLQERLEALAVPAWSPEQESSWRQRTDEMRHAAQAVPSL